MILRELLVSLGLNVDEQSFAKGQIAASLVTAGLKKLADVGLGIVHSFAEQAHAAIEYGDKINKTSQSIGIATGALQELQFAGKMADLSAEEMSASIGILSRKMQEAKKGGEEAGKAFKGIEFKNKDGTLKSADEVLGSIADKFQAMPDGAEKTALAMELFGRAGKQMIPLLNKGSEDLANMRKEAQDLGLVMGKESVEASEELNDNLERLHMLSQGLWRSALAPLIPAINRLVTRFLEWKKANGAIIAQKIQSFLGTVIKGIELLGEAMDLLIENATAVKVLLGVGGLIAVFNAVSLAAVKAGTATMIAWIKAAAPFLAIGAAIAALLLIIDDIRGYYEGEDSVFGDFMKAIDDFTKPRADDPWFVAALRDFVVLLEKAVGLAGKVMKFLAGDEIISVVKEIPEGENPFDYLRKKRGRERNSAGNPSSAGGMTPGGGAIPGVSVNVPSVPTPEVRMPEAPVGGVAVHAPANFTFVQQPGQTDQGLVDLVKQQIGSFWETTVESAAGGIKP